MWGGIAFGSMGTPQIKKALMTARAKYLTLETCPEKDRLAEFIHAGIKTLHGREHRNESPILVGVNADQEAITSALLANNRDFRYAHIQE